MDELLIPDTAPPPEYRVLARKYRPASFDALIGQDAMVRTLGNSIRRGQLAQAWLLTGVRGVGKTSTARIIAKALNCVGPDGQGGPTIAPCGVCEPCVAIAAGRHIDIVEMDAASNTGIGDIREIIEAVRYAAVSARYKIYIIDEVHMLSTQAFNGLLKTLEEPPPHVKFIFATTEVQKLPVTVLSRCQRFDLRRIPAEQLAAHFAGIVEAEGATADAEALALIARAAEGSVRDGLSILDQAIAHGSGNVEAAAVRDMLGLSDRGSVRALMGLMLAGDAAGALAALGGQLDLGTDPAMIVQELLGLVHTVTRAKVAGDAPDPAMSAEEREAVQGWASTLSFPAVHRLWQLLLKGLAEVQTAPVPGQAAEMAVLRVIHASSLPDPGELVRRLSERGDVSDAPVMPAAERPQGATVQQLREPAPAPEPAPLPADFEALVRLFETRREPRLAHLLHDEVRVVDYAPPLLSISGSAMLPPDFAQRIMACLLLWTATRWTVTMIQGGVQGAAAPTMHEAAEARVAAERAAALADPAVQEILAAFPDAELTDISYEQPRSAADA
ncbi:DNA polymerase III subunit gamma/tau [Glacieibacterium frigidum]|uniref:DNA polymerase III subunit gamma/tau n=1 Tax=Glacieibacterium frigidum TaxID=2593303 RepID=A0A552U8K8_9SPHN|nr:DNA polymerase III subunit gamma/tau [Glacieibacterium frigidum]TRW14558.1 DNA polymerase III subunit gamma/tau [Glacieibacterium frigidum]